MHGDAELQEAFDIACMLDEHQVVSDLEAAESFLLLYALRERNLSDCMRCSKQLDR